MSQDKSREENQCNLLRRDVSRGEAARLGTNAYPRSTQELRPALPAVQALRLGGS